MRGNILAIENQQAKYRCNWYKNRCVFEWNL